MKKITELTELVAIAGGDWIPIVDVSDPGTGTTKKIKASNLSKTISFGLTIYAPISQVIAGTAIVYTCPMPAALAGYNLTYVQISCDTKSTSGLITVQVERGHQASPTSAYAYVNSLSTVVSIDANEYDSDTAATPYVIDTNYDDISEGDKFRFTVPNAGTGAQGLSIVCTFTLP